MKNISQVLPVSISPNRLKRHIDHASDIPLTSESCPFCRENVFSVTPTFHDGNRIIRGESVTFPNLFPFGEDHVVTVITRDHSVQIFNRQQIVDALFSQIEALLHFDGYASINWNFLPSAGASLIHPHMQGLSDSCPSRIVDQYLRASQQYQRRHRRNYWEAVKMEERASERYLFGDEILWSAHAVPVGEREVRGILPISSLDGLEDYVDLLAQGILEILSLYRKLGTYAFNMSIFFDKKGENHGFCAFCSIISRINPNPFSTSDSAFMERLHLEPVILTLPEDLGKILQKRKIKKFLLEFCNEFLLGDENAILLVGLAEDAVACLLEFAGLITEYCCDLHHFVSACNDRDIFLPFLGHETSLYVHHCNSGCNFIGSTCLCECVGVGEFTVNSLVDGHDNLRGAQLRRPSFLP